MATMKKKKTTFMLIVSIFTLMFVIRNIIILFNPIIDKVPSQSTLNRNVSALALDDMLQAVKESASTESVPNAILSSPELAVVESMNKSIPIGGHVNIPAPHSRIGPNGVKGFVHDPRFLHKNPKPFQILKSERKAVCALPGQGIESPRGAKVLHNIRNHIETAAPYDRSKANNIKVFCAIYTYEGRVGHTEAVTQTWGNRCDGLLFASSIYNNATGHVHLPSNSRHGWGYNGMNQRVRSIQAYLYDNFLEDYDYFHISGDDVYIMMENLKEFLASSKVQEWENVPDQYFFGGFWNNYGWGNLAVGEFYLDGGSGYTISKKALKAYVEGPLQVCDTKYDGPEEDLQFGKCIFKHLTKKFLDTRDTVGAHRYHQMPVWAHVNHPVPATTFYWADKKKQPTTYYPENAAIDAAAKYQYHLGCMTTITKALTHLYHAFSFPFLQQEEYISNSSIVFHRHKSATHLKRYEMLLYGDGAAECGDLWVKSNSISASDGSIKKNSPLPISTRSK